LAFPINIDSLRECGGTSLSLMALDFSRSPHHIVQFGTLKFEKVFDFVLMKNFQFFIKTKSKTTTFRAKPENHILFFLTVKVEISDSAINKFAATVNFSLIKKQAYGLSRI
jgi:hypothetical protein